MGSKRDYLKNPDFSENCNGERFEIMFLAGRKTLQGASLAEAML